MDLHGSIEDVCIPVNPEPISGCAGHTWWDFLGSGTSLPLTTHTEHRAQLCSRLDMKKQLRWKPTCFSLAFLISKSRVRCIVRNCTQQPLYLIWEQTMLFPASVSYPQNPELPGVQGVRAGLPRAKTAAKGKKSRILQQLTAAGSEMGRKSFSLLAERDVLLIISTKWP